MRRLTTPFYLEETNNLDAIIFLFFLQILLNNVFVYWGNRCISAIPYCMYFSVFVLCKILDRF